MKNYKVTMTAMAEKVFNVQANDAHEASEVILNTYFNSDAISVTEDDISSIYIDAYNSDTEDYCECECVRVDGGCNSEFEEYYDAE